MEPKTDAKDIMIPSTFVSLYTYTYLSKQDDLLVTLEPNPHTITFGELCSVVFMSPVMIFGVLYCLWFIWGWYKRMQKKRKAENTVQRIQEVEYSFDDQENSFTDTCVGILYRKNLI